MDSANAESSLLRSEAGDLRRELERLRLEREASEAALRRELDVATRCAADAETALRVTTDSFNRATEELGALDGEFFGWPRVLLYARALVVTLGFAELRTEHQLLRDTAASVCARC